MGLVLSMKLSGYFEVMSDSLQAKHITSLFIFYKKANIILNVA